MTGSVIQSFTSLFLVKRRRGLKLSTIVFPNIHFFFLGEKSRTIAPPASKQEKTGVTCGYCYISSWKRPLKKKKIAQTTLTLVQREAAEDNLCLDNSTQTMSSTTFSFPSYNQVGFFFLVRWCLESECGKRNFLQTSVGNNTKEDQIVFVSEFLTDKKKKIKKTGNTNVYTLQPTRWQ